jgi:hypothetical protein
MKVINGRAGVHVFTPWMDAPPEAEWVSIGRRTASHGIAARSSHAVSGGSPRDDRTSAGSSQLAPSSGREYP